MSFHCLLSSYFAVSSSNWYFLFNDFAFSSSNWNLLFNNSGFFPSNWYFLFNNSGVFPSNFSILQQLVRSLLPIAVSITSNELLYSARSSLPIDGAPCSQDIYMRTDINNDFSRAYGVNIGSASTDTWLCINFNWKLQYIDNDLYTIRTTNNITIHNTQHTNLVVHIAFSVDLTS